MAEIKVPLREFKKGYEQEGVVKGYECNDCGYGFVTIHGLCPNCRSDNIEATEYKGEGEIISYTMMTFSTERFMEHAPFAYICVKLDEGATMSGWIPGIYEPDEVAIGDRVRYHKTYKPGVVFEKVVETDESEDEEGSAEGPGSEWLDFGA